MPTAERESATLHAFPAKRLLPASDAVRRNIVLSFKARGVTRICAVDMLMRHCGMSPRQAVTEIDNARE